MITLDDVLCVIPARGGSKGIPGKNLRLVGGKPLVAHSIEHAIQSNIPRTNIVVSSDSDTILDIATQYKVVARRRPIEISGDNSPTEAALIDALDQMPNASHVLLLQPTSPIRFKETITKCLTAYDKGDHDSLLTVTKFYNFFWAENPLRTWTPTYFANKRPMRQDLRRQDFRYFDNGNIYITKIDLLIRTMSRIGVNPCVYPISELEGLQIDTPEDLKIIDAILSGKVGDL